MVVSAPDGYVNFRYGPDTAYDIITQIPNGTYLTIEALGDEQRDHDYHWGETEYNGNYGWVALSQVKSTGRTFDKEEPAEEEEPSKESDFTSASDKVISKASSDNDEEDEEAQSSSAASEDTDEEAASKESEATEEEASNESEASEEEISDDEESSEDVSRENLRIHLVQGPGQSLRLQAELFLQPAIGPDGADGKGREPGRLQRRPVEHLGP